MFLCKKLVYNCSKLSKKKQLSKFFLSKKKEIYLNNI